MTREVKRDEPEEMIRRETSQFKQEQDRREVNKAKQTSPVQEASQTRQSPSTQDTPAEETPRVNPIHVAPQTNGLTSSSKSAKPTRAPLPPPFVPSRELHNAASTTMPHAISPSSTSFPVDPPYHPANGIAFGFHSDSASISPVSMQTTTSPFPPPFLDGAHPPPHMAHHVHYSGEGYPLQHSIHTAVPPYPPNPDYAPPVNSRSAHFARPSHLNGGANHMSRTPSQASSVAVDPSLAHHSNSGIITPDFPVPMHNHDLGHDFQPSAHAQHLSHSGAPTAAVQQPLMQSDMGNLQALRHYLLDRFGSYDFADYILDLATNKSLPAHSMLLARSLGFRALMSRAGKDETSPYWHLKLSTDEYYKDPDAFVDAVRYLYGGDLLDPSHFLHTLPLPETSGRQAGNELNARMTYVLSYVASGLTLDLAEIHVHGVRIADRLLRWESIEPVLDFSLNSHFQKALAAQHLLHLAVGFIIMNFPVHFSLDTTTAQLLPRLPTEQEPPTTDSPTSTQSEKAQRRKSHHRLKSIRFGDAAPSADHHDLSSSPITSLLSGILLSLPFELLTTVFQNPALVDRLGRALVAQHMHAVVREREKRRHEALEAVRRGRGRSRRHPSLEHGAAPADSEHHDEALRWREAVETSEDDAVGLRIVRRVVEDGGAVGAPAAEYE